MHDSVRARRRARDAGLAAVNRWTRRAVAGGIVLAGLLGAGLAHLLPGQAATTGHSSPAATTAPAAPDPSASVRPRAERSSLAPPSAAPRRTHGHPHATSGGS